MKQINFSDELGKVFKEIGKLAKSLRYSVYLVGGPVRDILLGRAFQDVDIVCIGNAVKLAKVFSEKIGGKLIHRPLFPNATVELDSTSKIDFVSARSERYPKNKVALPKVRKTKDLIVDLERRDFTVNAMAVDLNPDGFGNLIDPFNGFSDCQKHLLRVLHENSFREDPTRIFRALRFSVKLSFEIEEETKKLLKRDLKFVRELTPERLWKEIRLSLESGSENLNYLKKYGVLKVLDLSYPGDSFLERIDLGAVQFNISPVDALIIALLEGRSIKRRPFDRSFIQQIGYLREINKKVLGNVKVVHRLFQLKDYSLLYLFAKYPETSIVIENFFDNRDKLKPELTGDEIKNLGIKEGPEIGKLMELIIEGRWLGKIYDKKGEIEFVKKYLGGKDAD
ncbi:MAG: hypothetical protein ABIN61_06235 [candidate division WOR-3 bacterium]